MNNWYLYGLVFVSGGSVLAVEILGTRILGPFYGVSLFLWSALITVTLAGLSVGYVVGGRWADRGPKMTRLCAVVACAGVWLLAVPWIKYPILSVAEPLGLRFAVLAAATILFGPPLTLLGIVSPYAIRLKAARIEVVGRTAGDLYAISTVASVVAALLTGFVLIPNVGVLRLTLMIGTLLLVTASVGFALDRRSKTATAAALLIAFTGAGLFWLTSPERADPSKGEAVVRHSAYAEIRVVDLEGRRHLLIDGGTHTIVDPKTWETHFPYVAVMDLAKTHFASPGKMLLVGLGGGTIAKNYAREGWTIDAVEIDPVVAEVAAEYFGLTGEDCEVYLVDGRQFLLDRDGPYDLIIMDAFGSSSIPFHLITTESMDLIANRLKPNGLVAINLEAMTWDDLLVRSVAATAGQHFANVTALPTSAADDRFGNVVLFASDDHLDIEPSRTSNDAEHAGSLEYLTHRAWDYRFRPDTRSAPVLTDDLNPVDVWSERINRAARRDLHGYFEEFGLRW